MTSKLHFYRQETPFSCVPACLRMVLSEQGFTLSEAELRNLCDCTPLGTEALKAVDAVRQLGFTKSAKLTLNLQELISLVDLGFFPIVFVNLLPIDGIRGGHAIIVVGVESNQVSVYDPLQGERIIDRSTFETAWAMMHNLTILIKK
ncbi:hypothetical protein C7H19_21215 [Aphanothece hegewaldii CCALA 016]|uniref:Peptidase C39 domain-containing protein n=1 Tax=Aphanothece hegewaldii CCALA 016 TaxID=2107694 RepID=A0A2T1LSB8_9CHRO|nr:cysteine peptidase family C39 domain-containing protein [Aphanothece hegewaldii]PSF32652.1 hypothetical protein C7H19_21215 [Aphanothece hegewaldii CCALA 016]